jgi:hypothetical protein
MHARTHARAQRARADAVVGMAVADEAVGRLRRTRSHSALATAAAHTVHSRTASIAAERCRLAAREDCGHRHREGAAGGRDGGASGRLVRRASASLQGTPQRRRWALAARMSHRACCALPASICSQLPRLTLCSVLRYYLVVCFFLCLFVWLVVTAFAKHTIDGAAYAARASSRG